MLFRLADGNECLVSGVLGSLEGFLYGGRSMTQWAQTERQPTVPLCSCNERRQEQLNSVIVELGREKSNVTCLRDCSATEWRFASLYDEKLRARRCEAARASRLQT